MKPGIRRRLLNSLFTAPRPINPDAFRRATWHLFPDQERFRRFLEASNVQEQEQEAKEILLSLIYVNRAVPPYRLLVNLLDYQKAEETKKAPGRAEYVARDHFVHLVNVYLLGVYIFSNFPQLHHRCVRHFNQLRRDFRSDHHGALISDNYYVVVGKALALFILYHDTGYPLQDAPPEERAKQVYAQFLSPFTELGDDLLSDAVIKAMTSIVLAYLVAMRRTTDATLGDMFLSHSDVLVLDGASAGWRDFLAEQPEGEVQLQLDSVLNLRGKWGDASYLPNLRGHRLRAFLSVFPDSQFCAVLERQSSGQPVAMLLAKDQSRRNILYFAPRAERPHGFRSSVASDLASSAFISGEPPRRGYVWHYFALDVQATFTGTLNELLPGWKDHLGRVVEHFDDSGGDVDSALGWRDGLDAALIAFRDFRAHLVPFEIEGAGSVEDEVEEHYSAVNRSVRSALNELPKMIGDRVALSVAEFAKSHADEIRNALLVSGAEAALSLVTKDLASNSGKLVKELGAKLAPEIEEEVEYQTALDWLRERVEKGIRQSFGPNFALPVIEAQDTTLAAKDLFASHDTLLDQVNGGLRELGLPDVGALSVTYRPEYVSDDRWVNHGLGSLAVMLESGAYYRECQRVMMEHVEDVSGNVQFLRAAFVADWPQAVEGARFEVEDLLCQAAIATAVHDLYPRWLASGMQDFRHSAERNPFVYLCLLADGLQEWDRARQQNLARSEFVGSLYGDRFDVEVQGDLLFVRAWGPGLRIDTGKTFRQNLGEYLRGLERVVRIALEETR